MYIPRDSANFHVAFRDKLNGHINVFYYIYAVIKYTLKKQNIPDEYNNGIITLILTVILCPIFFTSIIIFRIYRFIVYTVLFIIHGRKFHSLLDGSDAVFVMAEQVSVSKMLALVLILVDHPGSGEDFFKEMKAEVLRIFTKDKFRKMHVTRDSFMGYCYYKNGNGVNEECIKTFLKGDVTSAELQMYISKIANEKLPLDHKAMWDIHIGLGRVTDKKAYPVIFRFHHSLGDGNTILNIFGREFNKRSNENCKGREFVLRPRPVLTQSLKETFINSILIDEADRNVFSNKNISGDKLLVWYTDPSNKYVDLIKRINKKRGGGYFMDVILTAVSNSLNNYAKKKTTHLPETINSVIAIIPPANKPYKYGEVEHYKLENKFTVVLVRLPLKTDTNDEDEDLKKRLKIVSEEYNIIKNKSIDVMFNRWQGRILCTLIPLQIIEPISKNGQPTLAFSNIPGCDRMDFLDNCPVKEFVIFDPNVAISGVSTIITTYENRLNIAFTFDKSIVHSVKEGEEICKDVLRTLDRLYEIL